MLSVLHHQDGVGVTDGREAVGDHEARPIPAKGVHGLLDQHLGAGVDRAGGLVEDEDGGIGEERPGDGEQLHLAGAHGAVLDRRGSCRSRRAGRARSDRRRWPWPPAMQLLLAGLGIAVGDVLPDGAAEQPGVLQHHAHHRAQVGAPQVADVVAVDGDATARRRRRSASAG